QLCDQPPVAAPPHRLRAEEARSRFLQRRGERLLPLGRAHSGGVTPEGRRSDAAETLLTRLAAAASAERFRMSVRDAGVGEAGRKRDLAELRIPSRARVAPDVDDRSNLRLPKHLQKLFGTSRAMANRIRGHGHRI